MKPYRTTQLLKVALLWLTAATALNARDDIMMWNWLSLNLWQNDTHKVHAYFDNRIVDDVTEENLWLASLRYKFKAHKNLQLGFGYTYIDVRNITTDSWRDQQRLEFEVNPSFKLDDNWKLSFRNRMEVRYYEDRDDSSSRFRHRTQLSRPIDLGPLSSYYANVELFYLLDLEKVNEVRTVPVGTGIRLGENTKLNLFYMIQSKRTGSTSTWNHAHALGTNLIYTF
ncbi:MAG TPA: hypothetical protein DCX06_09830 [Opitutae bacterium]|nr:hypothetical protein [Opitutae bacterium]